MFDVSFSELAIIAVVALIVIGPERLPKVARTAGHLLGRLQRYVNDVKADINREMQLDELKKMQTDIVSQAQDIENEMTRRLRSVESDLNRSFAPVTTPESAAAEQPAADAAPAAASAALPSAPAPVETPQKPAA